MRDEIKKHLDELDRLLNEDTIANLTEDELKKLENTINDCLAMLNK